MDRDALGLIETAGLVAAIEACDAAAKAAEVTIESAEVTDGTLVTIKFEGELGAVQAAAEAGAQAASRVGELVSVHVIPRPDDGLDMILPPGAFISKYRPVAPTDAPTPKKPADPERFFEITDERLAEMTVVELRQFARKLPKLGLKGREISHASKTRLIEEIKKAVGI